MCNEQPPLPIFAIFMGVVGVVVLDKTMKKLPEYPDGTRDLWCLLLTMMGFAGIMVCASRICILGLRMCCIGQPPYTEMLSFNTAVYKSYSRNAFVCAISPFGMRCLPSSLLCPNLTDRHI